MERGWQIEELDSSDNWDKRDAALMRASVEGPGGWLIIIGDGVDGWWMVDGRWWRVEGGGCSGGSRKREREGLDKQDLGSHNVTGGLWQSGLGAGKGPGTLYIGSICSLRDLP